jgi:hypothetical protein
MGVRQDHIEGRLFVGTSGADVITFVCLRDGSYGIARNGEIQQTWEAEAMDVCLAAFHRMIDRRSDPDETRPLGAPSPYPPAGDDPAGPATAFPPEA